MCAGTGLSKHGTLSDRRFPDFQRACARWRGGGGAGKPTSMLHYLVSAHYLGPAHYLVPSSSSLFVMSVTPPPLKSPPPCNPPPLGGRPSLHCFAMQYLLQWFVFPICHTHVLALLSHYFKSVTCVYSVIFSLQRRCTGCGVPFSDPRCFVPVTVYGTTDAHLVHMCWPLLWGLYQMGCSFATFGTYDLVGSLKWIMTVLNSQGSRLWWLHHPSLQSRRTLPQCLGNPKRRHSPHSLLYLCSVCLHQ